MAGVGRWVRDPEHPDAAEVAVVVGDCHQGQGLGTALGTALADGARALGIARFTAMMLPENTAAQRLFAHISASSLSARASWPAPAEARRGPAAA